MTDAGGEETGKVELVSSDYDDLLNLLRRKGEGTLLDKNGKATAVRLVEGTPVEIPTGKQVVRLEGGVCSNWALLMFASDGQCHPDGTYIRFCLSKGDVIFDPKKDHVVEIILRGS